MASSTPTKPPSEASKMLSVNSCRMTRTRPAPMLSRTAISRRLAADLASSRFAVLAQASSRIKATTINSMKSGAEYCRRRFSRPPAPLRSVSLGRLARSPGVLAVPETQR
jgi:hypothetical protein